MTEEKQQAIQAMQECGLRAADSYKFMPTEAGGDDGLGHTIKDHYNWCYKLKMKSIDGKDSQMVVDKLYDEVQADPDFFFRVRLNNEGKVCCFFWRDSMMLEDYKIFGDVMVFDTTYRTNKYNLICAPFVGINNHWSNSMFGCAFLGDETTESFEWVFQTFLKSMKGKYPVSIVTDQDAAIAAGISKASIRTKTTKEERVKSAKAGREDKNEYKSRTAVKQNKRGGSSNRQKDHKKFMPIAAKRGKIARSKQEKKRKKISGKQFRGKKAWK